MSPIDECKDCKRLKRIISEVLAELEEGTLTKSWLEEDFAEMAREVLDETADSMNG